MTINKRHLGNKYEELASAYLEEKGYKIIERNFYTKFGELDIIAKDGDCLVFTEVKYRSFGETESAFEAVDKKKQMNLVRAARLYFAKRNLTDDTECRFDVIGIADGHITHIRNAFDAY